jgi:hypothetical protein
VDYFPDLHDFQYVANVHWPGLAGQVDWVSGVEEVEQWLTGYVGSKYQRWAWHWALECYDVSVAFKYDKHRSLFLLAWS